MTPFPDWVLRCSRLMALAAAAVFIFSACTSQQPQFKTVDISGVRYARELNLSDEHGKPVQLADYKGKVVVVFFGYTSCPDVCPTTLATLAGVEKKLGAEASRVQVLFVTLDPERDKPAVLTRYLANFDPDFMGLYGSPEQTQAAAKEFKVFYQKVEGPTEDSYTVDHTAASFVLDPQGEPRLYVPDTTSADDWVHDLQLLLKS
jgi:protein SCO1/2